MGIQDDFSVLMARAAGGDSASAAALLAQVYEQLRRIAQVQMNGERRAHTLQATALVNEAYLRLMGGSEVAWAGRGQFFHAAGEAMRRILVEHARARACVKRGGDGVKSAARIPLNVVDLAAPGGEEEILSLDQALSRLEGEEPDLAAVVRLRFFAGLNGEQTASALGVSARQVDRLWAFARAKLYRFLEESDAARG